MTISVLRMRRRRGLGGRGISSLSIFTDLMLMLALISIKVYLRWLGTFSFFYLDFERLKHLNPLDSKIEN